MYKLEEFLKVRVAAAATQRAILRRFGEARAPNGSFARENFASWFGASKVVDSTGAPQVVFHGTARSFSKFSVKLMGKKTGALDAKTGFFFAENPKAADMFTWEDGSPFDGNIMPVYLKLENPKVISDYVLDGASGTRMGLIMQQAKADGHDGVVFEQSDMLGHKGKSYAVFDPGQVKSATGNSGAFRPTSDSLIDSPVQGSNPDTPERERMRS